MASSDYKKFNREVKGYVEVEYETITGSATTTLELWYDDKDRSMTINKASYTQDLDDLYSGIRYKPKYAVLNNNYTQLNGEFQIINESGSNSNVGFYSQYNIQYYIDYAEAYQNDYTFALMIGDSTDTIDADTYGVTLYFKNKISDIEAILVQNGTNINAKNIVIYDKSILIIFDRSINGGYIQITDIEFEDTDNRIMLDHIDLGMSHIFVGDELSEFTITEEVNKLVEETPNGELDFTFGDYQKLFDPLNKNGMTQYLTENVKFIAHLGIVQEDGSVDYDTMGTFYFNEISYQDKEVTIKAYNLMNKLSKTNIVNNNGYLYTSYPTYTIGIGNLQAYLDHYLEYEVEDILPASEFYVTINNKIRMSISPIKMTTLANFLQNAVMVDGIFYIDRFNNIVIKEIDKTPTLKIEKSQLLKDTKYTNEEKVTAFNLERDTFTTQSTSTAEDVNSFSETIVLQNTSEVVVITSEDPTKLNRLANSNLTVTGTTSYNIITNGDTKNEFNYMIFIRINGNIGDSVTITGKQTYKQEYSQTTQTEVIGSGEPLLTINNPFYLLKYYSTDDPTFSKFLDKAYSYRVSFDYNGNPFVKAGDYIEVESDYGTIPLFVEKHTLKFNGGLSGSVEGVE